jgi:hypothetical protein
MSPLRLAWQSLVYYRRSQWAVVAGVVDGLMVAGVQH